MRTHNIQRVPIAGLILKKACLYCKGCSHRRQFQCIESECKCCTYDDI